MVSRTTFQAWPFLISTDATSGFATIVAPDFMLAAGTADLLRTVTDGEETPNDAVYVRAVTGGPVGSLLVAYRISAAPGALLDRTDDILLDRQGRRILLIEGIVVTARLMDITALAVSAEDFAQVRAAYHDAFRAMWTAGDVLPTRGSRSFALSGAAPLRIIRKSHIMLPTDDGHDRGHRPPASAPEDAPPTTPHTPTNLLLILFALAITIIAFLAVMVRLLEPYGDH